MIRNAPESVTNLAQTRLFSLLDPPRPSVNARIGEPSSCGPSLVGTRWFGSKTSRPNGSSRELAKHGADLAPLVLEHEFLRLDRGTLRHRRPHEEDGRDAERDGGRDTPEAPVLPLRTINTPYKQIYRGSPSWGP
jgi:hypothetical protein